MGFRRVDAHIDTVRELRGKRVYLAVYTDDFDGAEVKFLVAEHLARGMDCGAPLEDFLAHIRAAILDSAKRHGNRTAGNIE